MKRKTTRSATEIARRRFYDGDPTLSAGLAEERANADVGQKIFDLRQECGLTQGALAGLIGTTASVISRLEDADYAGHSLAMLRRIAEALNRRVTIEFEAIEPTAWEQVLPPGAHDPPKNVVRWKERPDTERTDSQGPYKESSRACGRRISHGRRDIS